MPFLRAGAGCSVMMTATEQPRPRERPILFSAPMVRAILEGRKTQTRRAIKPQPTMGSATGDAMWAHQSLGGFFATHIFGACMAKLSPSPYGRPGDRLWVKETIRRGPSRKDNYSGETYDTAIYSADDALTPLDTWPWQRNVLPSIHCPYGLSRIALDVTGVRVEQLGQMSFHDAIAEGIYQDSAGFHWKEPAPTLGWADPRHAFADLWDSINGKGAVNDNPWVWVVEFQRARR